MKKWARRIGLGIAAFVALLVVAGVVLWKTGEVDRLARAEVVRQVEKATGGRVTLNALHLQFSPFTAELDQLTIHGNEPPSAPPFVHIARITVHLDLWALLGGKVILGNVSVVRPSVYIHIDPNGHSNVPHPPNHGPSKPWQQRLFSITINHLRLEDGEILFNDRHMPLSASGGRFTFAMEYLGSPGGNDHYHGQVAWKNMELAAKRWIPFPSSWSVKFTIGRKGGSLDQVRWELPHSWVEARAKWPNWTQKRFEAHYRVSLNLRDIRKLLKKPHTPIGTVETTGNLQYAPGDWSLHGYYSARNIGMTYKWYHAKQMKSRGTILADPKGLEIPDFQAWSMGGEFTGRVLMNVHTLDFTAITQSHKVSLARLLGAVQNKSFPVETLHWDSNVDIQSVTTWRADFKDVSSHGKMQWTPMATTPSGLMPATASIEYRYQMTRDSVFAQGKISTPDTRVTLKGTIGSRHSNMATDLTANRLRDWDDLINAIRGPEAPSVKVTGRATWRGNISGHISDPLFSGQVKATDASYDQLHFDEVAGKVAYSQSGLTLTRMQVRRGRAQANISLHLSLTKWSFLPKNEWSLRARLDHADTADLQKLAGTHYPAHAWLTGNFQGDGTRSRPEFSGDFQLDNLQTHGFSFSIVTGRMELDPGVVRVAGVTATLGSGKLGGQLSYFRHTGLVQFDLFGRGLPLDEIPKIQSPALPLAGRLDFRLIGNGPPRSPKGHGSLRISSLRAGNELVGDLAGQMTSDGKQLQLQLTSSLTKGKMSGTIGLTLKDDYPIHGQLAAEGINLDPFIKAGLHLKAITGQSRVDGKFQLSGELLRPATVAVSADVSRFEFAFENVKLENVGPIRLVYRKSDVRLEQAELKGPDSNFKLSGVVRFNRDEPLDLRVLGALNLKLVAGFVPQVSTHGAVQMDALIEGTFSRPRIRGRAKLEDASLSYGDIPIGLNALSGELIFSSDHASFTNLRGKAGGGNVELGGTVTFPTGSRHTHYDITIQANKVRVRWPAGMSWLLDANARMVGDTQGATLGGTITLDRLLLTNGPDAAALLMMAPHQPTVESETTSPFLRNLQLDFTVDSGAGARLEWTGANIETDANLRIRGTWSRPSVLGHVHLLSGEVNFRGNKYRLSRGDMNFANPLQLDPVLDIEATTTIQQYDITVDLTGRASALRLHYSSDPPLPETDVISLLALGYTGEGSEVRTTGLSGQFGATALLSQAVSSEVGGRIARLFGISRFSVEPFPVGAGVEPNAAARITIQQQVTPNLTVTYATNTSGNTQQVIQIEYAVSRDISIVALRDINGTFGIDVEFKKHFK